MSKSNRPSAITWMFFVPLSRIENTDAGCSELWRMCTVFVVPVTNLVYTYNLKPQGNIHV